MNIKKSITVDSWYDEIHYDDFYSMAMIKVQRSSQPGHIKDIPQVTDGTFIMRALETAKY